MKKRGTEGRFKNLLPAVVIIGTFVWASSVILLRVHDEGGPGTITIRIGHWQLETGVRDAFDELARDYERIHPNIRIEQDAIPESTYGQWMTTQLIGRTAPDLMEIGLGPPPFILVQFQGRYFVPMTPLVGKPNPYNKGSSLEGVPLRETFKDGMRSAYVPELQEYTKIGLSQFGVRIFYNKDLLKKLTGLDEAPKDYRTFLAVCATIKSRKLPDGKSYTPITSSSYHLWAWEQLMIDILTYPAIEKMDFNRDGTVDQFEHYVAFKSGRMSFDHPAYRARFKMFTEVSNFFNPGWTGLGRDEAVFQFAQNRAVFISTGSWDSRLLEAQAEGRFKIGVIDFPRPLPSDPDYGPYVRGPVYETPWTGFPFGLTRTSKHPAEATDFLLYLASQRVNEKFNRIIGWIPGVLGTTMAPMLANFEPHLEGVYGVMNFVIGGNTWVKWNQDYSLFKIGQISYDELAKRFAPYYAEQGIKDYAEGQRDWRRAIFVDEGFLAGIRGQAMLTTGAEAAGWWIKYRALTATRLVTPEVTHARQDRMVEAGPDTGAVGPYEYSPAVLKRIRVRLGGG